MTPPRPFRPLPVRALSGPSAAPRRTPRRSRTRLRPRPAGAPLYWRMVDDGAAPLPPPHLFDLWITALASRGIPYRTAGRGTKMRLYVPVLLERLARAELEAMRAESRKPRPIPAPIPTHDNAHWVLTFLLLLALWHGVRVHWGFLPDLPGAPRLDAEAWVQKGALDVFRTRALGEWYRTVTALTLHADSQHLFGNMLFGAPFLILVCRRAGLGLGLFLTLLAGAFGNVCNALYRPYGHVSLGFSTALFGTVGVLSGLMALQGWGKTRDETNALSWRRGILLLAAGTGVLAMLGTDGNRTDYAAHLFGLLSGFSVGGVAGWLLRRTGEPSRRAQAGFGVLSGAILWLCWRAAL